MEPTTEKEVMEAFKSYSNVAESWELHDSVLISNRFYASELSAPGWFLTVDDFVSQETHSFFKSRTEAMAGASYCNQQSADSMDFAFVAYSIGITFFAPSISPLCSLDGETLKMRAIDPVLAQLFTFDMPRHCAVQFKTNQDVRMEAPCYAVPPGYGPVGGGASSELEITEPTLYANAFPTVVFAGTQGVPVLRNRFKLPVPIGIPRTATIEGILYISEYGRYLLDDVYGPSYIPFEAWTSPNPENRAYHPARFGVQMSLLGKRLVQQRGQYHV